MSKTLRLVLASLFVFVFAFSLVVTLGQDAQAKENYSCCSYMVYYNPDPCVAHGVWIDDVCHCQLPMGETNPNNCTLYCPPPY